MSEATSARLSASPRRPSAGHCSCSGSADAGSVGRRRTPGGGLVYHVVTGHCHLYEALRVDTAADRGTAAVATEDAPAVVAAITMGKPAAELARLRRDPQTQTRITSRLAEVTPAGNGRMHWKVRGPLGRGVEWDTRVVENRPGSGQRRQSVEGASLPCDGEVRFRPAPGDRGTEVTLRIRSDPPGGALGLAAAKLPSFLPSLFDAMGRTSA